MSTESDCVLQLEGVDLLQTRSSDSVLREVDFSVSSGDLHLMEVRRGQIEIPLGDAVCGVTPPDAGTIRFNGASWSEMSPRESQLCRHRIGRFHVDAPWVSNLNIDENILLGECHHTGRSEVEIVAEALAIAERFELKELTHLRPHLISQSHSRVYQLVRAFLGEPSLVFLERPLRGVAREYGDALIQLIHEHRERGCAVIWISSELDLLDSSKLSATHHYSILPPSVQAKEEARA